MQIRNKAATGVVVAALATGLFSGTSGVASATSAASAAQCRSMSTIGLYCGYYGGSAYTDYGDTGSKVREIQALLTWHNFSTAVDGIFGGGTRTAVKGFQNSKGLPADGIVGPQTWEALRCPC